MSLPVIILFALIGLGLGSALWIVARSFASDQLPAAQPGCPYCPGVFPATAWVPLLGATVRCTNCRRTMGRGRWAFDIAIGASFVVAASRIDSAATLIEFTLFTAILALIMLIDFWTGSVYRNLVFAGMAIGLAAAGIRGWDTCVESMQGLLAGIVIFGAGMLLLRKILPAMQLAPIGGGDVLIAGMIGAMARWPATLFTFFAGVALAAIGVAVVLFLERYNRIEPQPFGPFLCAAAIGVFAFTF